MDRLSLHPWLGIPGKRRARNIVIKQVLEISAEPAHLAVRRKQLLIQRNGKTVAQSPCEDIGIVVVDHPQTTYTHNALDQLAKSDAVLVICGSDHLPSALLLPLSDHSQVVWRVQSQISVPLPICKQLWRQIVVEKILSQARNLPPDYPAHKKLVALSKLVRSGDPQNIEAQAAKLYWQNWLWQDEFRRDANGPGLNGFLNYGYAIVRAAIARAIVSAGLLPSLGLHHCNRSNMFCLADDLIEPLRAIVDDRVREMYRQGYSELNQHAKATLIEVLTSRAEIGDTTGPLMVALHQYVGSLVKCYSRQAKKLEFPRSCL